MADIIGIDEILRKGREKRWTYKFPVNILRALSFNETFGTNLDYGKLDSRQTDGLIAWINAADALTDRWQWESDYITPPHNFLKDYYYNYRDITDIMDRSGHYLEDATVTKMLTIMKESGMKFGFPLWVLYGADHFITSTGLITVQSGIAKAALEKMNGTPYTISPTIEELYPVYCLRIAASPFRSSDIQNMSEQKLIDYVHKCETETDTHCKVFSKLLSAENWLNGFNFESLYIFYPSENGDDGVCSVCDRINEDFSW